MGREQHWGEVYRTKAPDSVSWFQPTPQPSLDALDRFHVSHTAAFIDFGGGASLLVDALVQRGWADLTMLDIAAPALEVAQARLGADGAKVHWEVADIESWRPRRKYDVWHDRAVFHFLTEDAQRAGYRRALDEGLAPDGLVIIATFALDGPERCSGLPVQRYDAAALAEALGHGFVPVEDWRETHVTPGGNTQSFTWCVFRRA